MRGEEAIGGRVKEREGGSGRGACLGDIWLLFFWDEWELGASWCEGGSYDEEGNSSTAPFERGRLL